MPPRSQRPDRPSRCSMRVGAHFEPCCCINALTQACGLQKLTKRFPPRPAACVTAAPAPKAGKISESGDGSALCAQRSMIVTSMQLTISSRRDIAVLQKESPCFRTERMSIVVRSILEDRRSAQKIAGEVRYVYLYTTTLSGTAGNSAQLGRGGPCWLLRFSLLVR